MKNFIAVFKTVIGKWLNEDSLSQSAAAAYYAVFSMPGLILVAMVTSSFFYDQTIVEQEIRRYTTGMIGQELSLNLQGMMNAITFDGNGLIAFVVGVCTVLFGASRFFMQLQRSLNKIWEVEVKKSSKLVALLKKRFMSLALVLCVGFVLMVTLATASVLAILKDYIALQIPLINLDIMVIVNMAVSYAIIVGMFTLIFRVVPDVHVLWKSAGAGALVSAVLFTIGQSLINYYFAVTDPQSPFGAAGSIILLMLWVSYAFMILLLGAHISKMHMEWATGQKAKPEIDIAKKSINPK